MYEAMLLGVRYHISAFTNVAQHVAQQVSHLVTYYVARKKTSKGIGYSLSKLKEETGIGFLRLMDRKRQADGCYKTHVSQT